MANLNNHADGIYSKPFSGYMNIALAEAEAAFECGEVPIGAAIADSSGRLISSARNRMRELCDPTAHAEVLAIRQACNKIANERLTGCRLYVTLEPCPMCASAISLARIERLYYATADPRSGGVESRLQIFEQPQCHHKPEIYSGIAEHQAKELLHQFFKELRVSE